MTWCIGENMGYYEQQQRAYRKISETIKNVLTNKRGFDVDALVIAMTEEYACSERAIRRRIEMLVMKSQCLIVDKNQVKYIEVEEYER